MKTFGQISPAYAAFFAEAPKHSKAWMEMVKTVSAASALDEKTQALAYLSVLAAMRMESGIPFHVAQAKKLGVTRDEVISAILIGLPAVGHAVTQVLPTALETFDGNGNT
jgi:alkylhydroperoxidase/carboxymuconolactone decarboxylase family protein YurZ